MFLFGVLGCGEVLVGAPVVDDGVSVRVLEEGTPESLGVVALLDDPGTTVTVLDVDAKLDARAARNLVAHRDGGDWFDSIAEVDAVPYVGDATLQLLVDFAVAGGWVGDDALYGVVEGIALTVDEAASALSVANRESLETLDLDVALDARAARNLVDGRPFASLKTLLRSRTSGLRPSSTSWTGEWPTR